METIEKYLHNLYRGAAGIRVQRVARVREVVPDADAGAAGRRAGASDADLDRDRLALPERGDDCVSVEGAGHLNARTINRARTFLKGRQTA